MYGSQEAGRVRLQLWLDEYRGASWGLADAVAFHLGVSLDEVLGRWITSEARDPFPLLPRRSMESLGELQGVEAGGVR